MANITFGFGLITFWDDPIVPGIPGLFDDTAGDFTTGTHSFTLDSDAVISVIDGFTEIDMDPLGESDPNDLTLTHLMGFAATGTSQWTLNINGTVSASASLPMLGGGEMAASMGLMLANGALATGLSTVNIGTEGAVYGNLYGIFSLTALTTNNLGVVTGDLAGINLPGTFMGVRFGVLADELGVLNADYYDNLLLSEDDFDASNLNIITRTSTITNAAGAVVEGAEFGVLNGGESNLIVANSGEIAGGDFVTYVYFTEGVTLPLIASYIAGAVVSGGTLTFTNSADGTIYGSVLAGWLGSSVVSSGHIYGTIVGYIDPDYIDFYDATLNPTGTDRVDVNRDGVFGASESVFTNTALVGLTVVNSGLINGYDATNEIVQLDELGFPIADEFDVLIPNVEIEYSVLGTALRDVLTNTALGVIYGGVDLGLGSDSISNAGQIIGNISLSGGNDALTQTETGVMTGIVNVFDSGNSANFDFGAGNDTLTAAGTINGNVYLSDGADVVTLTGDIEGELFTDLAMVEAEYTTEASAAGDGNDVVTTGSTTSIFGGVYLGFGNNTLTNAGEILGSFEFYDTNSVTISVGNVVARDGNDTVTNTITGLIAGGVDLGAGNNTVSNQGRILSDDMSDGAPSVIITGAGNDTLTNAGTIGAGFALFEDGRTTSANLYNDIGRLDVATVISLGGGADALTNTGNIFGNIDMGAGNDTVTGGNFNEVVVEGEGADRYTLGAGADAVLMTQGDASVDTLDGGLGIDILDFTNSSPDDGHRIDLTAGRVFYEVTSLTDSISGSSSAVDVISGFEQVIGSSENDFILGSAAAETLDGGAGDDYIRGGGGRDVLTGGDGVDTFVFALTTDSGRTRATRDVITDFDIGSDTIDFQFDSNTALAGIQSTFVFAAMNDDFSGTAGSIRAYFAGGSTLVEVDTNGDKIADFTIELLGQVTLDSGDFFTGL